MVAPLPHYGGAARLSCITTPLMVAILLLLLQVVSAQSNSSETVTGCESWTTNDGPQVQLTSQRQIEEQLRCRVINRGIYIQPAPGEKVLNFTGITRFASSLEIAGSNDLVSIVAPDLIEITSALDIRALRNLETLQLSQLAVLGSLTLRALPKLNKVESSISLFVTGAGLADTPSQARVWISNTGLESLNFLSIDGPARDTRVQDGIHIDANDNLTMIAIEGLTKCSIDFNVTFNGVPNGGASVTLPGAKQMNNILISSVKSLYVPELNSVGRTLSVRRNTMTTLDLPSLTRIDGSFIVEENEQLDILRFSRLLRVGNTYSNDGLGGINIRNNSALATISIPGATNFTAEGGFQIQGNISYVQTNGTTLPFGPDSSFFISSTNPNFICDNLDKMAFKQWPSSGYGALNSANYYCSKLASNGTVLNTTQYSDAPQEKNRLSKEIAGVLVAVCAIGVILGGLIVFRTRKHRLQRARLLAEAAQQRRDSHEWIELENGERIRRRRSRDRGVNRQSEEGERPPIYERVGKPGEVPPQYLEVLDSNTTDDRRSQETRVDPAMGEDPITALQRPTTVPDRVLTSAPAVVAPADVNSTSGPANDNDHSVGRN